MSHAQRIEALLSSPDLSQIRHGLFLLDALGDVSLLSSLSTHLPARELFSHTEPLPAFSQGRALAQVWVLARLSRHLPDQPVPSIHRTVRIHHLHRGAFRPELVLSTHQGLDHPCALGAVYPTHDAADGAAAPLRARQGPVQLSVAGGPEPVLCAACCSAAEGAGGAGVAARGRPDLVFV